MRKSWLNILLLLLVVGLVGCTSRQARKKWVNSTTPTIFVHGYGSSSRAEDSMVAAARKAGVTDTVVQAQVKADGRVTLHGPSIKGKRNPIIQVNLQNNRNTNMADGGRYIRNVVWQLKKKDNIKSFNLVGHSMGNTDNFAFLNDYGQEQGMPQLKKQVVLAGAGMTGAPVNNQVFQRMVTHLQDLKNNYPHAQVLNIMGDKGGGTDGRIDNQSSRSIKQMLGDRPASYRQVVIHGAKAQHSKLHENSKVFKLINQFLWGR